MSGPSKWSLGGEAPQPAEAPSPKPADKDVLPSETHTGTDPYGRAIGPKEDHTEPKRDSEGLTVPEAGQKREATKKAQARKAAAKKAPAKKGGGNRG
jgi:hypothetical protein